MITACRNSDNNLPRINLLTSVSVTILAGVHIESNLKWDIHVDYIVSAATPKLFFLATR